MANYYGGYDPYAAYGQYGGYNPYGGYGQYGSYDPYAVYAAQYAAYAQNAGYGYYVLVPENGGNNETNPPGQPGAQRGPGTNSAGPGPPAMGPDRRTGGPPMMSGGLPDPGSRTGSGGDMSSMEHPGSSRGGSDRHSRSRRRRPKTRYESEMVMEKCSIM